MSTTRTDDLPDPAEVVAAAERVRGRVLRTPLRRSPWLSSVAGGDVFLKLETLQPTFSYKVRGAVNAIRKLLEQNGARSGRIVTASAGNHGRALAYAAGVADLSLTVYVPETAPRTKLEAIRSAGADVRPCADYDEAERRARDDAASSGATFISAYTHPDVIAGAGTIGLEILEDRPDTECVIVPVGGGGLISGVAIVCESRIPVYGVEAAASCPFSRGLAAGGIVRIDVAPTLADGLAGNLDPSTITFDVVRRLVAGLALVSEDDLKAAIAGLVQHERLVVEAAGAAAAAAILSRRLQPAGRVIAVVISGGNIDPAVLKALL
ncbi:MAG TPA: threonine/serine dehydratase [Vicinamibacterales bacterium]|nr:threonine/serine dehydratase [Vicinamibacterales bacterium]